MYEPARYRYILHYLSIARNVLWYVFRCVLDSEACDFPICPVPAAEAEESLVDFPASIEQNWRRDDGHESLRLPGGFVQL